MAFHSVQPIFIVGCPRSGTTLLQSLIAAHPQVLSFPESHFFYRLIPTFEPRRLQFGISSKQIRPHLQQFFQNIGHPERSNHLPRGPRAIGHYTRIFAHILHQLASQKGKSVWLEKSPEHLYYISYIQRFIPPAKILHILRQGPDVVASLYDVRQTYNQSHAAIWGKPDLDACLQQWIDDVTLSLQYAKTPNHLLVSYDQVIQNPESMLQKICQFIGISFTPNLLQDYKHVSKTLVLPQEEWKQSVSQDIINPSGKKFKTIFNQTQQNYILQRIAEAGLATIDLNLN